MQNRRRWARNTLRFYRALLRRSPRVPLPADAPRALLLYGWFGRPGTMLPLCEALRRNGIAAEILPMGGWAGFNTESIEALAERLESFLVPRFHGERIALVGHSIGGLVARFYCSCRAGDRFVHTLVMLGSPNRGSPLARKAAWLCGRLSPALAQITPGAPLLAELARHPIPATLSCANIFSPEDRYCPPAFARLDVDAGDDHVRNIALAGGGHVEYVVDPGIIAIIRAQLRLGFERAAHTRQ